MDIVETQKKEEHNIASIRLNRRQLRFIEAWLDPASETFGNTYQSGIAAGFSKKYSEQITSDTRNLMWLEPAKKRLQTLQPEHIYSAMQNIAIKGKADRDRLRALELMAKIQGMFIERSQSEVSVSFVNKVPRPASQVIDVDDTPHVA